MKVRILVQNGQTGLRKVGTLAEFNEVSAKLLIKNGFAEKLTKPKPKKKKNVVKPNSKN